MAAAGEEMPESSAALQKGLEQFQQKGVDSQRGTSTTAGEESFRAAIERANTQESDSLALRAAVSLAGLLPAQRRTEEARTLLANALRRFPDALHSIEIDAARAQLDELTRG